MSYWLKVLFCTFTPTIILYFIAWPYYNQNDDAYNTFKHLFFQISVFGVPSVLIAVNYFFARNRKPLSFVWNALIIASCVVLYVEQRGLLYRTPFRWISPPGFLERVSIFQFTSIFGTLVVLVAIQLYILKFRSQAGSRYPPKTPQSP